MKMKKAEKGKLKNQKPVKTHKLFNKLLWIIFLAAVGLVVGSCTYLINDVLNPKINPETEVIIPVENAAPSIEFSEETVPTVIETDEGELEIIEAPTVEEVDAPFQMIELINNDEIGGLGAVYPVNTLAAFKESVIGKCINQDGYYGSQCWDLADALWENLAGRHLSTCGTGAAKGTLNCTSYNAGNEFEMIYDVAKVKSGDVVVFTNGVYGHIGIALAAPVNGYVSLLGTNQGGKACPGGGAVANIINISTKSFGGAFRPKAWNIDKRVFYYVKAGDNLTKIGLKYNKTVAQLLKLNPWIVNPNIIKVNQKILVKI